MTDDELIDAGFDAPVRVMITGQPTRQPLWLIGVVTTLKESPVAIVESSNTGWIGVVSHDTMKLANTNICGQL